MTARDIGDLVLESRAQGRRVVGEPRGRPQLLHVDLGLERRRAVEGIDGPRQVLVEPEREEDVVAGDGVRHPHLARAPTPACVRGPPSPLEALRPGRPAVAAGPAPASCVVCSEAAWRASSRRRLIAGMPAGSTAAIRAASPVAGTSRTACPGPTPPVSPTNGIPCRSTASRLIRSAAVFWPTTSRT